MHTTVRDKAVAKALGETVRAARLKRGMTMIAMCVASGRSGPQLYRMERGAWEPSVSLLLEVAAALNTTAWNLLRNAEARLDKAREGATGKIDVHYDSATLTYKGR